MLAPGYSILLSFTFARIQPAPQLLYKLEHIMLLIACKKTFTNLYRTPTINSFPSVG